MPTFELAFPNKKKLTCTVEEMWVEIISRPLLCGQKFERTVTRRTGVSREHRENLEANIGASLGIKGLAKLESAIKTATSSTYTFEEMQEVTEKISIEAPVNGRYTLLTYQLKQIFRFEYVDTWFGWARDRWTLTVEKWLEKYLDQSQRVDYDPACGGKMTMPQKIVFRPEDQIVLALEGNKINVVAGVQEENDRVRLPTLNLAADANIKSVMTGNLRVDAENIPEHLRFLGNIQKRQITASIVPVKRPAPIAAVVVKPAEKFKIQSRAGSKYKPLQSAAKRARLTYATPKSDWILSQTLVQTQVTPKADAPKIRLFKMK
jgi:hypothetical protein